MFVKNYPREAFLLPPLKLGEYVQRFGMAHYSMTDVKTCRIHGVTRQKCRTTVKDHLWSGTVAVLQWPWIINASLPVVY